ncbi:MAG: hypothetical protein ACOYYS_01685 [Chloroflexota bacterium]
MNKNSKSPMHHRWLFLAGVSAQLVGIVLLRSGRAAFEAVGGCLMILSPVCLGAFLYLATAPLRKGRPQ